MKQFLFFIFIAFIATSCKRTDPRILEYFDTEGYGYVFYRDTGEPVPNAEVELYYTFPSPKILFAAPQSHSDIYITDSTGFYRVKFLKSKGGENIGGCTITAFKEGYCCSSIASFNYNFLNNTQKIIEIKNINIEN